MTRPVPLRDLVRTALLVLVSQAATLARIEPFCSWHTPIAWTGYILLVDGLVWKRRGNSWLSDARAEFLFLAFVSVPLWIIFEMYNKYTLHNWHYVGLPESLLVRYFGYAWAFATIWPAIFETGDLVSQSAGSPRAGRIGPKALRRQRPGSWRMGCRVVAGAADAACCRSSIPSQ